MEKKYNKLFIFCLFFAFFIRLWILPLGNHWDILAHTDWSEQIYLNGPNNFYETRTWLYTRPSQPPLIHLIYGFNQGMFRKAAWLVHQYTPSLDRWFNAKLVDNQFSYGEIIFMKLFPILADLIIAILIFLLGSSYLNKKKALLTSLIYLFIPYTFYLSALWGQYDQVSALFLLLAFLVLYSKKNSRFKYANLFFPLSVFFYFVAIEIKPLAILGAPFYIFYFLKTKPSFTTTLLSIAAELSLFFITTAPFSKGNSLAYFTKTILPLVFDESRYFTSSHAFNFWAFISPMEKSSLDYSLFTVSAQTWGFISLLVLNFLAILVIVKNDTLKNLILSLFIINGGYFIFFTGMYDRYYFAGLLFFLILSMFYKKIFFLWIIAGLIFTFNLFVSWGYPIDYSEVFWSNYNLIKTLSFLQLLIFMTTVLIYVKTSFQIKRHGQF